MTTDAWDVEELDRMTAAEEARRSSAPAMSPQAQRAWDALAGTRYDRGRTTPKTIPITPAKPRSSGRGMVGGAAMADPEVGLPRKAAQLAGKGAKAVATAPLKAAGMAAGAAKPIGSLGRDLGRGVTGSSGDTAFSRLAGATVLGVIVLVLAAMFTGRSFNISLPSGRGVKDVNPHPNPAGGIPGFTPAVAPAAAAPGAAAPSPVMAFAAANISADLAALQATLQQAAVKR